MTPLRAFFGGAAPASSKSAHDFTIKSIDNVPIDMKSYAGKVVLVVNVASK